MSMLTARTEAPAVLRPATADDELTRRRARPEPQRLRAGTARAQPSIRWVLQKEVRSVLVAAWAAALNLAVVEIPFQFAVV